MTVHPIPDPTGGDVPEFTLGDRLRKARQHAGLEMRDLAETIDIHRQSVARYENGAAIPRRPIILSWSLATGVSLEWLTSGSSSTHDEKSDATTVYSFDTDYSSISRESARVSH